MDAYRFPVTAEVITAESCEQGDAEQRGYIDWTGCWCDDPDLWDLRKLADTLPSGYVEGSGGPVPDWITIEPGSGWWLDPFCRDLADGLPDALAVSFSVHRPAPWRGQPDISDASWLRVIRALGWRWRY